MQSILTYFNTSFFKHVLFWLMVFLYFILSVSNLSIYSSYRHLLESYGMIVLVQMIIAYGCIYILIPRFLERKKIGLFMFWMLILFVAVFMLYQAVKMLYFDVKYFEFYGEAQRKYAVEPFLKRLSYPSLWVSKFVMYFIPTGLLLVYRFYKDQRELSKINEQKKIAELTALKQQLNPHFLFNTLNNLYALALEKSERTPEVIERLSDMLDYMLYPPNSKFV